MIGWLPGLASSPGSPWPRPPGATERFRLLCDGCMDCAGACPHGAIGRLRDGTPAMDPETAPCHLCEDLPCARACPTGALEVVPRELVLLGLAVVETDRCLPHRGPECGACGPACPVDAIRIVRNLPEIDLETCLGCGLCRAACPVPGRAIRIDMGFERPRP